MTSETPIFEVGDKVKKGSGKTIWAVTYARMLTTPWTARSGKVSKQILGIESKKIKTGAYDITLTLVDRGSK